MFPLIDVTNTSTGTDAQKVEKKISEVGRGENGKMVKTKHRKSSETKSDLVEVQTKRPEEQCKCHRVPSIPNVEFLSNAVQTLNISKRCITEAQSNSSVVNSNTKERNSLRTRDPNTPNSKETISTSSSHECVACKLEFSTLDNLTKHLIKHILEGLHAATWLSNAMSTLLPQQSPSSANSDSSSSNTPR